MTTTTFLGHFNTSNDTQCNTTLLDNIVNTNYKPVVVAIGSMSTILLLFYSAILFCQSI